MPSDLDRCLVLIFCDWLARQSRPHIGRDWLDGRAVLSVGRCRCGSRRQASDQPIRCRCERNISRMMIDAPRVQAAGNMPTWRCDDVAMSRPYIDTATERRIVHLLGDDVRYL